MNVLHERIKRDARVLNNSIIKVDNFLNHQVDCKFMQELAHELMKRYEGEKITKVLTAEVSGIAIASIVALEMNVPMLFARKVTSQNLDADTYTANVHSYTKNIDYTFKVSKRYLTKDDHVLIIDDFLANGQAVQGLVDITKQAGATLAGIGIIIEKGFQDGGKQLREQGLRVESLAIVDSIENDELIIRE